MFDIFKSKPKSCEQIIGRVGDKPSKPLSQEDLDALAKYFIPDEEPDKAPEGMKITEHFRARLKGNFRVAPGQPVFSDTVSKAVSYAFGEAGDMVRLRSGELNCGVDRDPKEQQPDMFMFGVTLPSGREVVVGKIEGERRWVGPDLKPAIAVVEVGTKGILAVNDGETLVAPVLSKWIPNVGYVKQD